LEDHLSIVSAGAGLASGRTGSLASSGDRHDEVPGVRRPARVGAFVIQTAVINGWHPTMSANGSHGHWATRQKKHDIDRDTAWATAMQAGWVFVPGRVRLTIVLVYPQRYGRGMDADNAVARCKGLIDGLKGFEAKHLPLVGVTLDRPTRRKGYFEDDSTDWLELVVRAEVEPGVKATRLTLEPAA
jgi:hypothetical protein